LVDANGSVPSVVNLRVIFMGAINLYKRERWMNT